MTQTEQKVTEVLCRENDDHVLIVTDAGEIELTRERVTASGHPGLEVQFARARSRKKVGLLEVNTSGMTLDVVFDNLGLGRMGRTPVGHLARKQINYEFMDALFKANMRIRAWGS